MARFVSRDSLWQIMVRHKLQQDMLPEYLPPEGSPSFTGPDVETELRGFKRDFDHVILEPLIEKFSEGADAHEIAAEMEARASKMQSFSAGNYLRASLYELISVIAPDYVVAKKDAARVLDDNLPANAQQPAAPALAALRAKYSDIDAQEVLADVEKSLPPQATVLMAYQTLNALVKSYGDEGEDYKAETAAMLKTRIGTAGRTHVAKPPAP